MNKKIKSTAKKTAATVGRIGAIALGIALILAHVAASAIGTLVLCDH